MNIICFSHLRWNFVYQRPQHLFTRFAKLYTVYFFEEPEFHNNDDTYSIALANENIFVVTPYLNTAHTNVNVAERLISLLNKLMREQQIEQYICWYYSPMALQFSNHLHPQLTVYDCMDELSAFKFAPPELKETEQLLFAKADIVFTGGFSLYHAKKNLHSNIYPFPSSIEKEHFATARSTNEEPHDQKNIPHPRLGFFGVIDERFDINLVKKVAVKKPEWNFVFIGPVIKINHDILPKGNNIFYLDNKSYTQLPLYLSGWDIALIPFAINESTKFISPTKTPEYLAAGKPVISTPIADVVNPYGEKNLVSIINSPEQFIAAAETILNQKNKKLWLKKVDQFLSDNSWDYTFHKMNSIIKKHYQLRIIYQLKKEKYMFDYLIVGAGFAGSVLAERLAGLANKKVLLIDKRNHIGGNTFDYYDNNGILVHKYGPHIFHTNSRDVFDYLSLFTEWRQYEHHVLASVDGQLVPIPINQNTVNSLYGLNLNCEQVSDFFKSKAEKKDSIKTSEDVVISVVGKELYEKFFKGYTKKQWGLEPSELDASVTARVPTRINRDNRYFTDVYQSMPLHGYTKLFENMLSHPNIKVMLNTDYTEIQNIIPYKSLIYTGPIDSYFNYCYGKLPYRSLDFKFETHETECFQSVGTVNYPNTQAYTRITEFKYLTGQKHSKTSIVYEYPKADGDPYYPIPRPENTKMYKKYQLLAATLPDIYFTGRLGTYKYYNMDQVVAQSLSLFKKIMDNKPKEETHELLSASKKFEGSNGND